MAVDKEKIERVLSQLPEELQAEVLEFAEALMRKTASAPLNGTPSVHSFFGVWDSGDPHSADNDRIDNDLAREFASPHEAK
ncbi:MAG TPA: DUF2281 domain-containing protein [Pyrinomonadaceae bacterium]|nr:DUF2281 domain-containing protein [Pyrinomonadaceae bacterium]